MLTANNFRKTLSSHLMSHGSKKPFDCRLTISSTSSCLFTRRRYLSKASNGTGGYRKSQPYLTSLTVHPAGRVAGRAPRFQFAFLAYTRWCVRQVCSVKSPAWEGKLLCLVERSSSEERGVKRNTRSDRETAQCPAVLNWQDFGLVLILACALSMLFGQTTAGTCTVKNTSHIVAADSFCLQGTRRRGKEIARLSPCRCSARVEDSGKSNAKQAIAINSTHVESI